MNGTASSNAPGADALRAIADDYVTLPSPLHDFQWEGVSFLLHAHAALLADEMGLGKTVQASVALGLLLELAPDVDRVLIVAPASLTLNWLDELAAWAPHVAARLLAGDATDRAALYALPIPVLVASYEQIRIDGLDNVPSGTFDLVVLDEAQRIKDSDSATSLACRLLPRRRAWALSATPLENNLADIATILRFIDPSFTLEPSRAQIAARLQRHMLRRRKRDVRRELPAVILQDIYLDLTARQRARYDELWSQRTAHIGNGLATDTAAILGLITRLKMLCNRDDATGASSKLDALTTAIDSTGQSARIIVFSQFVTTLEWLAGQIPLAHDMLTGRQPLPERQAAIERFLHGATPRVLFISLRAGGVGLNLGEATHVFLVDRWWNPAVENQAIYRAHRFNRSTPLHVIRFIVRHSVEERIASLLADKAHLFDEVVEDASSRPPRALSRTDLLRILGVASKSNEMNPED